MTFPLTHPDRRHSIRGVSSGEPQRRDLAARVLGSYKEMPGLCLRVEQAARLFGVGRRTCEVLLEDLVRAGQLRRTVDGQYARGG